MKSFDNESRRYTLTVVSENTPGVLHRLTSVFTRRNVNIESLTVSETEQEGFSRFTVVFASPASEIQRVVKPVRKLIEVVDAYVHVDEELVFKEIAFLKIAFSSREERELIERKSRELNGEVILENGRTVVLEKSGSEDEINVFRDKFRTHHLLTFIRSGRIAIERGGQEMIDTAKVMTL